VDAVKRSGPVIPSPPWNRVPPRSSIRRRDPLNRKAIVDAAIRILDVDGLDGFTMRRVAEALGTGPASLYWHVGSKDGLLDLVFGNLRFRANGSALARPETTRDCHVCTSR
jgi:AcrR family transcriptional regulator